MGVCIINIFCCSMRSTNSCRVKNLLVSTFTNWCNGRLHSHACHVLSLLIFMACQSLCVICKDTKYKLNPKVILLYKSPLQWYNPKNRIWAHMLHPNIWFLDNLSEGLNIQVGGSRNLRCCFYSCQISNIQESKHGDPVSIPHCFFSVSFLIGSFVDFKSQHSILSAPESGCTLLFRSLTYVSYVNASNKMYSEHIFFSFFIHL